MSDVPHFELRVIRTRGVFPTAPVKPSTARVVNDLARGFALSTPNMVVQRRQRGDVLRYKGRFFSCPTFLTKASSWGNNVVCIANVNRNAGNWDPVEHVAESRLSVRLYHVHSEWKARIYTRKYEEIGTQIN